jgi:hypothetical protein
LPNVLAGLHLLDGLPLEFHAVTPPLCHLGHFASRVSLLGDSPK